MLSYGLLKFILSVVPAPELSLDPVNPPTLGEQLILQCQATSIRGITSRLDFVWTRIYDDEVVVQTVMGANRTNDSLVYTDTYTTPMALSESDIGTVYLCTISLNNDVGGEILTNSLNITLDTSISKYMYMYVHYLYVLNIFNYMLNTIARQVIITGTGIETKRNGTELECKQGP